MSDQPVGPVKAGPELDRLTDLWHAARAHYERSPFTAGAPPWESLTPVDRHPWMRLALRTKFGMDKAAPMMVEEAA